MNCRLCGDETVSILDLGEMALTGVFPKTKEQVVPTGRLDFRKCVSCGLAQLGKTQPLELMYGDNYGYRSGLNASMVRHLKAKVEHLAKMVPLKPSDVVLDIGSNDGTTLGFFPECVKVGIDPTSHKFAKFYQPGIIRFTEFFSEDVFRRVAQKAKVITSIAMLYDLEEPQSFVRQIANVLHPEGVWHTEQSYLPLMMARTAYDTICHEHIEYYGLKQIKRMADCAGLVIVEVSFNEINGGSFAITLAHKGGPFKACELPKENLGTEVFYAFANRVRKHKDRLHCALGMLRGATYGLGASTKGNVLLQYCGIKLPGIADVNPDKIGCFTPGSLVPIVSEEVGRACADNFLVFPWHFREDMTKREAKFLERGGKLIFPLPNIETV